MRFVKWPLVAGFPVLLALLATPMRSQVQAQPATRPQPDPSAAPLSNRDVIGMVKAGLSADVVVAAIKSTNSEFDTSPAALVGLKAAGVPESVILAMVSAPKAAGNALGSAASAALAPSQQKGDPGPCVVLKRMGPADEVTSHLYSFGMRGKQFQYVEGELPKGVKFHGRLTDHDVRSIQSHGGRVSIIDAHYTDNELANARSACSETPSPR